MSHNMFHSKRQCPLYYPLPLSLHTLKLLRSCLTLLILDVGDGALAISKATHSMYNGSVLDLGGEITNFIVLHMDSNLLDIPYLLISFKSWQQLNANKNPKLRTQSVLLPDMLHYYFIVIHLNTRGSQLLLWDNVICWVFKWCQHCLKNGWVDLMPQHAIWEHDTHV